MTSKGPPPEAVTVYTEESIVGVATPVHPELTLTNYPEQVRLPEVVPSSIVVPAGGSSGR